MLCAMHSNYFLLSLLVRFALAEEADVAAPVVTAAPEEWLVRARLKPRAVGADTCGWVNGLTSYPITCEGSAAQCASNSVAWGCCTGALDNCVLPTICFEASFANILSVVGNSYTVVCTDATAPYCQTLVKNAQYAYACGTASGIYNVLTVANGGATAGGIASAAPTGLTNSRVVGTAAATGAGFNIGAAAPTSANSTTTTSNSGSSGSSLSTGAIAAIAVCGGLVAIAAICLIAFIVHKRHRRRNQPAIVSTQSHNQLGPSPPPATNIQPGTQVGGNVQGQPMTQQNMNALLANQGPNEWAYVKPGVPQHQTAAAQGDDGIKVTEIMPDDAIDSRQHDVMSNVGSNVPTAVAPTVFSHNVQGV